MRRHRLGLRHLPSLLATAIAVTTSVALARPRVALGEVTTRAAVSGIGSKHLRELVERELASLDLNRDGGNSRYIVSVSLIRFDAHKEDDRATARCEVSAVLRRADGDTLVAMFRGRGAAENSVDALDEAKSDALAAAVRGAVRRVPEALR